MRRRHPPHELTPREREVLKLLRAGLTNEEIAQRLHISVAGAKYHVSEILSKLGVATREEAAAWRPAEQHPWYWKLAWLGGAAALAITAALALVAIPVDRSSVELESDVLARDSDPKNSKPGSVAASATPAPVDPSRPPTPAPGVSVPGTLLGESEPASEPAPEPAPEAAVEPTPPPPAEPTPSAGPFETPGSIPTPRMSLDMETTGNGYDDVANSMTVGPINSCATSVSGNNAAHNHTAHLVVQDVADLVGWQARFNYDGAKMRPLSVNYAPFTDTNTGQNVSFLNLPLDGGSHRDILGANSIPAPAAGPQTALVGAVYLGGSRDAAVSPDTPPKSPPDDTSYSAPSGGVLAAIALRVEAGHAGQVMSMDLDDSDPNTPGSSVVLFTETGIGQDEIYLGEGALGDGSHGEGATCPAAGAVAPSRYAGALFDSSTSDIDAPYAVRRIS